MEKLPPPTMFESWIDFRKMILDHLPISVKDRVCQYYFYDRYGKEHDLCVPLEVLFEQVQIEKDENKTR